MNRLSSLFLTIAALLAALALAFVCAGGFAMPVARAEGGEALLTVADEGPGIPAAQQEKIWQRFYRCDTSRAEGGTGLGLSIVKNAVLFHGGTIEAHTRYEGGLEFTFTLKKADTPPA